jgi:ankyrin repeat protein
MDTDSLSPIHWAILSSPILDLLFLLGEGMSPEFLLDRHSRLSLLDVALQHGRFAVANVLLTLKVDWVPVSPLALSSLVSFPVIGDRVIFRRIVCELCTRGFDPASLDENGKDLLSIAAESNRDLMRFFFEERPDIMSPKYDSNRMMIAAKRSDPSLLAALIDKGVGVDFENSMGKTALMKAVECGCYLVVEWLLKHGASTSHADVNGVSALAMGMEMNDDHLLASFEHENVEDHLGDINMPHSGLFLDIPTRCRQCPVFAFGDHHPRSFISISSDNTVIDLETRVRFLLACPGVTAIHKPRGHPPSAGTGR